MKDSFAVSGMVGDINRSDYSTLVIERSPSRKISAKRLEPAETSCAERGRPCHRRTRRHRSQ
jgi:hypothetical protein